MSDSEASGASELFSDLSDVVEELQQQAEAASGELWRGSGEPVERLWRAFGGF